MKYIKKNDLPVGRKVWACAYSTNSKKEDMSLICNPVYGQIVKTRYSIGFVVFKKNNELRSLNSSVSVWAREYADTYEESFEIYNELVQKRIDWLNKMIEHTKSDFLKEENNV